MIVGSGVVMGCGVGGMVWVGRMEVIHSDIRTLKPSSWNHIQIRHQVPATQEPFLPSGTTPPSTQVGM